MVQIVNYSSRAFVVTGDTKPIKDVLKIAGGRFNGRLSTPTGKIYCGWVFSNVRRTSLEALLTGNGIKFTTSLPENINADNVREYQRDPDEDFINHGFEQNLERENQRFGR
jgi:hypothetical protein